MLRVIYNPVAGPRIVRKIEKIERTLERRGISFEISRTSRAGHATLLAREAAEAGWDAVVAVGGDGTINEAANGLAGSATRLAVVPHGTGNVFAREVRLPATVEGCLDLLQTGETIDIPLGRAEGRYFVLLASAGFDAEVVERLTSRVKRLLGQSSYVLEGFRHLLRPQPPLWMEFPGRDRIEAQAVLVCHGRIYGNVRMAPEGNLTAPTFQVIALLRQGRWAILKFFIDVLRGRHVHSPHVLVREAPSVLVRCRIPSAAQVDGDYLGPLPVRFEMTGATLRVVVPRDFRVRNAP